MAKWGTKWGSEVGLQVWVKEPFPVLNCIAFTHPPNKDLSLSPGGPRDSIRKELMAAPPGGGGGFPLPHLQAQMGGKANPWSHAGSSGEQQAKCEAGRDTDRAGLLIPILVVNISGRGDRPAFARSIRLQSVGKARTQKKDRWCRLWSWGTAEVDPVQVGQTPHFPAPRPPAL